jgi:hypothetical protein
MLELNPHPAAAVRHVLSPPSLISGTERGLHWTPILTAMRQVRRGGSMDTLVNGLLWVAMFAIPMAIAVILRRLGRKYGLDHRSPSEDPSQEPDYRRWA